MEKAIAEFGIDKTVPAELGEMLDRYNFLAGTPARTDEEEREVREILSTLRARDVDPGWEPVPRQR